MCEEVGCVGVVSVSDNKMHLCSTFSQIINITKTNQSRISICNIRTLILHSLYPRLGPEVSNGH